MRGVAMDFFPSYIFCFTHVIDAKKAPEKEGMGEGASDPLFLPI